MPDVKQLTGLKKRQQIASANRMIFVWVIIASVVVSMCGVTMQFLVRQAMFNQKVIAAKYETQQILAQNINNVPKLKQNVDSLMADDKLSKVKANPGDTNLKVVLDALPTSDDRAALGASLQQVILSKSGVDLTGITTITPGSTDATATAAEAPQDGTPTADFSLTASGDYGRVKAMLGDIERTIRPMNIKTLSLRAEEGNIKVTIAGVSYYMPQQTVGLGKRPVTP